MAGRRIWRIGDSTNNKEGAEGHTPYCERVFFALPIGSVIGCVAVSIGNGNATPTTSSASAQAGKLTEWALQHGQSSLPAATPLDFIPIGYRMGDGPISNENGLSAFSNFYSTGLRDFTSISPGGVDWISGNDTVFSMCLVGGRIANDWVDDLRVYPISNHEGSQSDSGLWASGASLGNFTITKAEDGITRLDVLHSNPTDSRIGIQIRGPNVAGNEPLMQGKAIVVTDGFVWSPNNLLDPDAYCFDSSGVGAWSASDWADTHDIADYKADLEDKPFVPDVVEIWLGQNAAVGEWTGSAWTTLFETKIIKIMADIRAAFTAASLPLPQILLVVPPNMSDVHSTSRFLPMIGTYTALAAAHDAKVLDLYTPPGDSLVNINPLYGADAVHPTELGADFVNAYYWTEFNAIMTPDLVGSVPADDAGSIASPVFPSLDFSENMVKGSSGTARLYDASDDSLITTLTLSAAEIVDARVNFTTAVPIGFGVSVYMLADAGMFESASTGVEWPGISDPTVVNWTMAVSSPPAIVGTIPADDATEISVTSTIQIQYDVNVTLGGGAITLHDQSDDSIVATTSSTGLAVVDDTLTWTLPAPLLEGKSYYTLAEPGLVSDGEDSPAVTDPGFLAFATETHVELTATNTDGELADGAGINLGNDIEIDAAVTSSITLTNSGTAPLVLGTIAATGDASIDAGNDPSGTTIAVGQTSTLVVVLDTSAAGALAGSVSIPSDDPDSPFNLDFAGTVLDAVVVNDPRQLYLSVAEAQAVLDQLMLSVDLFKQAWESLDTDDQLKMVYHACVDFDSIAWDGFKASATQAGAWPRINRFGEALLPGGEPVIPTALAQTAWSFPGLPREIREGVALQAAYRAAVAIGVETQTQASSAPSSLLHPSIKKMVGKFLARSVGML